VRDVEGAFSRFCREGGDTSEETNSMCRRKGKRLCPGGESVGPSRGVSVLAKRIRCGSRKRQLG